MINKQIKKEKGKVIMLKNPGSTGKGKFYHIEVRPKDEFIKFRVQDVGDKGGLERVAGQHQDESWSTVAWLISKDDAHISENKNLIITGKTAKSVLKQIQEPIKYVKGDIFQTQPR